HRQQARVVRVGEPEALERSEVVGIAELGAQALELVPVALLPLGAELSGEVIAQVGRDPVVVEQRVVDVEEEDGPGHPRNGVCAPLTGRSRSGNVRAAGGPARGVICGPAWSCGHVDSEGAMNITKDQLTGEVAVARKQGWFPVFAQAEKRHKLPAGLLLAIASRETNMKDVVGDGGHGRGLFQIDDRSHSDFLAKQGAAGAGGKPPIAAATDYAAGLLASNLGFGQGNGVPAAQLIKFACSAYNAGPGNALAGFKLGDSDKRTAGGDYGRDVVDRLAAIQASNGAGPTAPGLQQGSRGPKVTKLKTDLQAWY